MITFNVNLSEKSFENLIQKLTEHAQNIVNAQVDVLQAIADYAYERIMFYVPVDTGRLMNSFIEEVSNDMARVYTDLYYAKYVEFGTGVMGANSSHPKSQQYGWSYGGTTTGQIAHKFVYQASLDVEQNYVEIAKNVLREKGLI